MIAHVANKSCAVWRRWRYENIALCMAGCVHEIRTYDWLCYGWQVYLFNVRIPAGNIVAPTASSSSLYDVVCAHWNHFAGRWHRDWVEVAHHHYNSRWFGGAHIRVSLAKICPCVCIESSLAQRGHTISSRATCAR